MLEPVGLGPFAAAFPERVFDVGIAEQHAVTSAAGLAMGGMRPVVCVYATFLNRAFDQVLLDVALHRQPVVFVLDRAGVTGDDGPSHNGMWDLSWLPMVPGLVACAPRDERDAAGRPAGRARPDRRAERGPLPEGRAAVGDPGGAPPGQRHRRRRRAARAGEPELRRPRSTCCWSATASMAATALEVADRVADQGIERDRARSRAGSARWTPALVEARGAPPGSSSRSRTTAWPGAREPRSPRPCGRPRSTCRSARSAWPQEFLPQGKRDEHPGRRRAVRAGHRPAHRRSRRPAGARSCSRRRSRPPRHGRPRLRTPSARAQLSAERGCGAPR